MLCPYNYLYLSKFINLVSMTNSPQDSPSRLDRIEAILATVATQQAANTQAISQLTQDVDYLREITLHNIELTQQNREQAEIRRIWEYLLQQSGNGHSGA
jgi:hypothetical protein